MMSFPFYQLTLLGADEGLFAVNVYREPPVLTKLNQFDSVHQLKFIPGLNLIILITGMCITVKCKLLFISDMRGTD